VRWQLILASSGNFIFKLKTPKELREYLMKYLQPRYLIAFVLFITVVHAQGLATNNNPFGPSHAPITGIAGAQNGATDLSPQPSFKPEGAAVVIGGPLTSDDSKESSGIGLSDQQLSEVGSWSSSSRSSTIRNENSSAVVTGNWPPSAFSMTISLVIVMWIIF
jgi:hypothetical protein